MPSEPIRLVCPDCESVHRVKRLTLGKLYRCKKCRTGLITMHPAALTCPNCNAKTPPSHVEVSRLITCDQCDEAPLLEVVIDGRAVSEEPAEAEPFETSSSIETVPHGTAWGVEPENHPAPRVEETVALDGEADAPGEERPAATPVATATAGGIGETAHPDPARADPASTDAAKADATAADPVLDGMTGMDGEALPSDTPPGLDSEMAEAEGGDPAGIDARAFTLSEDRLWSDGEATGFAGFPQGDAAGESESIHDGDPEPEARGADLGTVEPTMNQEDSDGVQRTEAEVHHPGAGSDEPGDPGPTPEMERLPARQTPKEERAVMALREVFQELQQPLISEIERSRSSIPSWYAWVALILMLPMVLAIAYLLAEWEESHRELETARADYEKSLEIARKEIGRERADLNRLHQDYVKKSEEEKLQSKKHYEKELRLLRDERDQALAQLERFSKNNTDFLRKVRDLETRIQRLERENTVLRDRLHRLTGGPGN